jgi:large subunit ribosomal protein L4
MVNTKKVIKKSVSKKIPLFVFATGKKEKDLAVPAFLQIVAKPSLIKQAIDAHISHYFQPSHTKTRAEVRGGGRKPWRQKGTGRARQGSIRAPHFVGGGVVFGPKKNSNKVKTISKSMKQKAILGILADKIRSQKLILIDKIDLDQPKTKFAYKQLNVLASENKRLLILANAEKDKAKPFNNIKDLKISLDTNVNSYDSLLAKKIIMTKMAFEELEKRITKTKE